MLLAPEFLLPAVAFYKALLKRLSDAGLAPGAAQEAPTAFIGVLFLLQVRGAPDRLMDPAGRDGLRIDRSEPRPRHRGALPALGESTRLWGEGPGLRISSAIGTLGL